MFFLVSPTSKDSDCLECSVTYTQFYYALFCHGFIINSWWRHHMETFSALLALCAGNSPVTGEFPAQRPVTRSFDVFFDLRLNKRLGKQREAGGLRRYRAHYDITVMSYVIHVIYFTIPVSVSSLALEKSGNCSSEVTLKDIGKSVINWK